MQYDKYWLSEIPMFKNNNKCVVALISGRTVAENLGEHIQHVVIADYR